MLSEYRLLFSLLLFLSLVSCKPSEPPVEVKEEFKGPYNIVYIMSDDHAKRAISAYDSTLIQTPNLDRLASEGVIFDRAFVTNSICGPSRAVMLTGKFSHLNGFRDNSESFNGDQWTLAKELQSHGYQTAMLGKWHLKTAPQGFDEWQVLIDQGEYYNPRFISASDTVKEIGYTTDIITEKALGWLDHRDTLKPFMLMVHHKAPHRNWMPNIKYLDRFNEDLPIPENFFDNYKGRQAAAEQDQMIERMYLSMDMKLNPQHYKEETGTGGATRNFDAEADWRRSYEDLTPEQRAPWDAHYDSIGENFMKKNLSGRELALWKYQRYMKDYLRCILSVDESVGKLMDYLEKNDLLKSTIVVYTSDQGFYLGEHGWYDKRFMYEESFGTPLLMHVPGYKGPKRRDDLVMNLDFAPTILDYAEVKGSDSLQGMSMRPLLNGSASNWRDAVYYHYYEYPHGWHFVKRHYGIRTERYKLIHFYQDIDTWELYDLQNDPNEMNNLYGHPEYLDITDNLMKRLLELQNQYLEEESIKELTRKAM